MPGRKYDDVTIEAALDRRAAGESLAQIARDLGMSEGALCYHCLQNGVFAGDGVQRHAMPSRLVSRRGDHLVRTKDGRCSAGSKHQRCRCRKQAGTVVVCARQQPSRGVRAEEAANVADGVDDRNGQSGGSYGDPLTARSPEDRHRSEHSKRRQRQPQHTQRQRAAQRGKCQAHGATAEGEKEAQAAVAVCVRPSAPGQQERSTYGIRDGVQPAKPAQAYAVAGNQARRPEAEFIQADHQHEVSERQRAYKAEWHALCRTDGGHAGSLSLHRAS